MAYDFEEGSSQRIKYSTVHADYTSTVSISFWLKAESLPGAHQMHFVDKGINSAGNNRNFSIYWTPASGGQRGVSWDNTAGNYHEWTNNSSPTTGSWEHWYVEIDWTTNPDTVLLWVNGSSVTLTNSFGTNNANPLTTATQELSIGGEHGGGGNYADGLISDVAIWSDIVGSTRATGLYNSGSGGLAAVLYPTNLIEDIPLRVDADNRTGGSGTLVNTPVISTDNPFSATILRASSKNNSTTGTAISVSAPTGTTTGDVVTLFVHANTNTTIVDNNTTLPAPTNLTSGTKTTDATSATTASITTVAGRLYLLSVASKTETSTDPNQPTATGTGLAFAVPTSGTVVYDNSSSSRRRVTFLWAIATASGSTTVVIDYAGQTQVTSIWSIEEIAYGFDTASPIVQAAQNSSPTTPVTSITATLGTFGAAGNMTFGCGAIGNGTDTITVGGSFTQLTQTKDTVENNLNLLTEYRLANDTTVDMSFTSQAEVGIVGVEIKASTATFTEDIDDYAPNDPTAYGHTVSVFSRRIQSGDPSTYNFTSGTSGRWSIIALTWKDPNATDIYDATATKDHLDSDSSTATAPSITTTTANAIHITMGALDDGTASYTGTPSGYTATQNTANQPMGVAYKVISTASATGTTAHTFDTTSATIAVSLALREINAVASSSTYHRLALLGVG